MAQDGIDLVLENQALKNEFERRQLDLTEVFQPSPDHLEWENERLRLLLKYVDFYQKYESRATLEMLGLRCPPVEPDVDIDSNWMRFRRWLRGRPLTKTLRRELPREFEFKHPAELNDEQIAAELEALYRELKGTKISIDLCEGVPPRLVYEHLFEVLDEAHDWLGTFTLHLDGCDGYCPGCFQRPWCETGNTSLWPEDEEASTMVLAESVRRYASPTVVSLQILKAKDAEHKKSIESLHADDFEDDDFEVPF